MMRQWRGRAYAQQGGPKDPPSKVRKVLVSGEKKWRMTRLGYE
jgi:hypothetical protein